MVRSGCRFKNSFVDRHFSRPLDDELARVKVQMFKNSRFESENKQKKFTSSASNWTWRMKYSEVFRPENAQGIIGFPWEKARQTENKKQKQMK